MFRAILRLTKKSDQNPESESGQEVEFVDTLKEQEKEAPDVGETEYLILFLKHPYYAGIPAGQRSMVMENVIHLAEKKAEKIGAETVVSTSYREYVQEREDYAKANFYLYISKSKNGLMQLELMEI